MRYLTLKLKYRIAEYFLITSFVWGLYLIWLIPFQLWWVGLGWEQFINWITWGTLFEMIISYPLTKIIIHVCPKISLYLESKSNK